MPRATNIYLCHIVQPRVKSLIKHFSVIQINRLELTAHLHFQPPACVAPSAGYPELSRTVLHVHRYYILNALSAQLRAFTQLFYSECTKAASPESGI